MDALCEIGFPWARHHLARDVVRFDYFLIFITISFDSEFILQLDELGDKVLEFVHEK